MAAHLPVDELPTEFDVIVEGTGLIQSLLAAALARAGKKVLHLDKNTYYGDTWANLMYRDLDPWMKGEMEPVRIQEVKDPELREGEKVVDLKLLEIPSGTSNVVCTVCEYPAAVAGPEVEEGKDGKHKEQEEGKGEEDKNEEGRQEGEDRQEGEVKKEGEVDHQDGSEVSPVVAAEKKQEGGVPEVAEKHDKPEITWEGLGRNVRHLSIDFAPKVVFSRGPMVDVLVESDVSRYLEFQAVRRLLLFSNGVMEQVPCSRADLFSSKTVSMIEKRKMMKFLTFCAEYEKHPEEYEEMGNMSFEEFLEKRGLTPNLIRFILHSIGSVPPDTPVVQGLKSTQTFLYSLGRYGNTPFLFPLYGLGDLSQSFCRFSAVYGGVYCLHRSVQSLIVNEENKCTGAVCTSGQVMRCSHVIATSRLVSNEVDTTHFTKTHKISRAVLLTDRSMYPEEAKGISVVSIPPGSLGADQVQQVSGIELDHSSCCCPRDTFLVHLTCLATGDSAKDDLQCFVDTLLRTPEGGPDNEASPRLLWSLFYNQEWVSVDQSHCHDDESPLPRTVHITSDPSLEGYGYGRIIEEAKLIFQKLCPGESFLPAPEPQEPIPERIIEENPSKDVDSSEADAAE